MIFIVTCVGISKALPVSLLPLLYKACCMANIERSLLNDDVILALAHPELVSYLWKSYNYAHAAYAHLEVST